MEVQYVICDIHTAAVFPSEQCVCGKKEKIRVKTESDHFSQYWGNSQLKTNNLFRIVCVSHCLQQSMCLYVAGAARVAILLLSNAVGGAVDRFTAAHRKAAVEQEA